MRGKPFLIKTLLERELLPRGRTTRPSNGLPIAVLLGAPTSASTCNRPSCDPPSRNSKSCHAASNRHSKHWGLSRNRVHEIQVLLPAPLNFEGSRDPSFDFWRSLPRHQFHRDDMICVGPVFNVPRESRNTRSILAFDANNSSRKLQVASTLSSAVTSERRARAFSTLVVATEGSTSSSSQHLACRAGASRNFSSSTSNPSKTVLD